jgi:hypothetical protein
MESVYGYKPAIKIMFFPSLVKYINTDVEQRNISHPKQVGYRQPGYHVYRLEYGYGCLSFHGISTTASQLKSLSFKHKLRPA